MLECVISLCNISPQMEALTFTTVRGLPANFTVAKRSRQLPGDRRGRKETIFLQLTEGKATVVTMGSTRKETQRAFVPPCTH